MPQRIDLSTWNRRDHYKLFHDAEQPFFSVTVDVDVTGAWRLSREGRAPFFLSALYLLLRAVDATEAFKLRIRGDEVWLHERVGIGTTIMKHDETFAFARFDLAATFEEFRVAGEGAIARVRQDLPLDPMPGQDDLVYHSTLPWLRFTSFTNAIARRDSIPRIVFGRVYEDGAAHRMPLSIEVHHALVDGLHVARLVERYEAELRDFDGAAD